MRRQYRSSFDFEFQDTLEYSNILFFLILALNLRKHVERFRIRSEFQQIPPDLCNCSDKLILPKKALHGLKVRPIQNRARPTFKKVFREFSSKQNQERIPFHKILFID
ncbi:hypothetical protein A0128_06805 [Leptospira tipperaryensis]|uniref:Uncharacterized protein n=1 Tax=Leptospira tipperaryensis TaxID=2564040 RepID=A0A1D7UVF2_9LEPT|nr:hypothetical protein A0128_06805 [Leptospira tipperaryensis]